MRPPCVGDVASTTNSPLNPAAPAGALPPPPQPPSDASTAVDSATTLQRPRPFAVLLCIFAHLVAPITSTSGDRAAAIARPARAVTNAARMSEGAHNVCAIALSTHRARRCDFGTELASARHHLASLRLRQHHADEVARRVTPQPRSIAAAVREHAAGLDDPSEPVVRFVDVRRLTATHLADRGAGQDAHVLER